MLLIKKSIWKDYCIFKGKNCGEASRRYTVTVNICYALIYKNCEIDSVIFSVLGVEIVLKSVQKEPRLFIVFGNSVANTSLHMYMECLNEWHNLGPVNKVNYSTVFNNFY